MSSKFPAKTRYYGNSLVITIPYNIVKADKWKDGDEVDVTLDRRKSK